MLSHAIIGPPDAPSAIAFCHGILGSGRNWRGFARKLVHALDGQWCAVLVDLRNHGDSPKMPPPNSIAACAADLAALEAQLRPFDAVAGHSFGGKVALAYAARLPDDLSLTWILDSDPGPLTSPTDQHEVSRVIHTLRSLPLPLPGRNQARDALINAGFSEGLARWMTTNLRQSAQGFVWRFDLDAVEQMIQDYFVQDLWDTLEIPISDLDIHLVRAANSDRWNPDMVRRAQSSFATLHTLPDAGHWLHVDNPEGLLQMMLPSLA